MSGFTSKTEVSAIQERPFRIAAAADEPVVARQLRKILASDPFRPSQRCCQFLQYVVTRALTGDQAALKERIIGAEVFGKSAGYDTSSDSIVRVRASEVRRRLEQYYAGEGQFSPILIRIPVGSYLPEILVIEPEPQAESPPPATAPPVSASRRVWWGMAALAFLATLAIAVLFRPRPTPLDQFWAPVL